jgi:NAD(P)-dependent dehydrogenase (short-subunit alcohol dehydrogenase family)
VTEHSYVEARYQSLRDRGVFITGGASGIGAEMVRAFGAQGAHVVFLDIDDAAGETLSKEVTGTVYTHCDVTDIGALREAIAAADREHPIDVIINNAARDDRHDMFSVEPSDWHRHLAVNLDHQFFATQEAARHMRTRQRGSVIMMGSISWMRGRPGLVAYTTAKAAINGLTKTLSRELGPSGIRVNCIVPGAVVTERQTKLWFSPEMNQRFIDDQALKFRLDGSHIARMALFLASDESLGCTGANFIVDAGLTQN